MDGIVLVPSYDKIIPGMLIAALRLNIPARNFRTQFSRIRGQSIKQVIEADLCIC